MPRLFACCFAVIVLPLCSGCAARIGPQPGPVRPRQFPTPQTILLGHSVKGEPITLHVFGDGPDATLVFSAIHGDEVTAAFVGRKLLEELTHTPHPHPGKTIALIPLVNPDGVAAGTRTNANGVDCNRNFPAANWVRRPHLLRSNPGTTPASEPETLAVMKAVDLIRPARIISIHSGLRCNNYDGPAAAAHLARVLASHNGYPVLGSVGYPTPGSFGSWAGTDHNLPTVTLELPRHRDGERAWAENKAGLLAVLAAEPEPLAAATCSCR